MLFDFSRKKHILLSLPKDQGKNKSKDRAAPKSVQPRKVEVDKAERLIVEGKIVIDKAGPFSDIPIENAEIGWIAANGSQTKRRGRTLYDQYKNEISKLDK